MQRGALAMVLGILVAAGLVAFLLFRRGGTIPGPQTWMTVAIVAGTSLIYATIGEILTERSGILNLGLEGIMIMGALSAFAAAYHSNSLLVGVVVAIAVGGLLASIHAFLTISLRADQVVSGLALTLFGIGLSSFLGQRLGPGGKPLVGEVGPRHRIGGVSIEGSGQNTTGSLHSYHEHRQRNSKRHHRYDSSD